MVQKWQNMCPNGGGRKIKSSILKQRVKHCNFKNALPESYTTMHKLYFASNILVFHPVNGAKGAKYVPKRGQKYKIVNFKADDAFEVL